MQQKAPALFPAVPSNLQMYSGLAAILQPQRTVMTVPLTQRGHAGQLQWELQQTLKWETDQSKQLEGAYLSQEANALVQGTRLLVELIAEHPLETFFMCAGAGLLVYLASRN